MEFPERPEEADILVSMKRLASGMAAKDLLGPLGYE
jgi:hypothetical protein